MRVAVAYYYAVFELTPVRADAAAAARRLRLMLILLPLLPPRYAASVRRRRHFDDFTPCLRFERAPPPLCFCAPCRCALLTPLRLRLILLCRRLLPSGHGMLAIMLLMLVTIYDFHAAMICFAAFEAATPCHVTLTRLFYAHMPMSAPRLIVAALLYAQPLRYAVTTAQRGL